MRLWFQLDKAAEDKLKQSFAEEIKALLVQDEGEQLTRLHKVEEDLGRSYDPALAEGMTKEVARAKRVNTILTAAAFASLVPAVAGILPIFVPFIIVAGSSLAKMVPFLTASPEERFAFEAQKVHRGIKKTIDIVTSMAIATHKRTLLRDSPRLAEVAAWNKDVRQVFGAVAAPPADVPPAPVQQPEGPTIH